MRYIQLLDRSVLLAPRRCSSHKEMLGLAGLGKSAVLAAGFLGARYTPTDHWAPFGRSVGLNVDGTSSLDIPSQLHVGRHRLGLLFASDRGLLSLLEDVCSASWGMTLDAPTGEIAVYSPLHPRYSLTAADVLSD